MTIFEDILLIVERSYSVSEGSKQKRLLKLMKLDEELHNTMMKTRKKKKTGEPLYMWKKCGWREILNNSDEIKQTQQYNSQQC